MICRQGDLDRLEWSGVLEEIAAEARTGMGRERARSSRPSAELHAISREHDRVSEMRLAHRQIGRLPIVELDDPRPLLDELQVAGRTLDGARVYSLVRLMVVARETADSLRSLDPDSFPALGSEWARFPDMGDVIDSIEGRVNEEGQLEDKASAELARLRKERRQLSKKLETVLEELFSQEWTEHVLRDRYVTVRNDRYVVPVRSDAPRRFPGIVHGTSATDRTLFVEPLETVEINNRLVTLRDEERQEERRILAEWTRLLAGRRASIAELARVLAEADALEAAAAWGERVGACRPEVEAGGGLELRRARHPLLERALLGADGVRELVPLDVDLPRERLVLVISGPNAGGKTVALKTIGLLSLLAHAGLPVPAASARFPLFGTLLADIGDEQSLSVGISTFSSHVSNLARMIAEARPPALMLIDEIGTGTDPAEGAALGAAILERLRARGVHVVATTHHLALKSWAYRTPGAVNAAAEVDEKTLRPTYRLVSGVAGASIGMTVAEQLGLDPDVVADARRRLDPAGAEAAATLESVRALASELERQREDLVCERREQQARLDERERRLDERQRTLESRWEQRFSKLDAEYRREARKILAGLELARDRRAVEREQKKLERSLAGKFVPPSRPEPPREAPEGWSAEPGDRVLIASLGRSGVVERVGQGRARVRLGQASFTVAASDLRPAGEKSRDTEEPRRPSGTVSLRRPAREISLSLTVIGERVAEATTRLDKYLDEAVLAGLEQVTVIHGSGTGRLREAIRELLSDHAQVSSWRPGGEREGGDGVTVVTLADD